MSSEQQQIAISESCGWRLVIDNPDYEPYWESPEGRMIGINSANPLPDYLSDLNSMHEVVKTLPQNLKPRYFAYLCAIVSGAISLHGYAEATEATAAQRCEAFLKTIEKWEEQK